MFRLTLLGLACGVAVVDQLDGGFALIELADGVLIDVSLTYLPDGVAEGTHLCVRTGRRRDQTSTSQLKFTQARGPKTRAMK
jgi:hypothetical protein